MPGRYGKCSVVYTDQFSYNVCVFGIFHNTELIYIRSIHSWCLCFDIFDDGLSCIDNNFIKILHCHTDCFYYICGDYKIEDNKPWDPNVVCKTCVESLRQ